jgi:hypothetical protein
MEQEEISFVKIGIVLFAWTTTFLDKYFSLNEISRLKPSKHYRFQNH